MTIDAVKKLDATSDVQYANIQLNFIKILGQRRLKVKARNLK